MPIVELIDRGKLGAVRVTAPSPVTDDMWEVFHVGDINDFGVFNMERENQTQFFFTCNPGFNTDQLMSIVSTGVYIAVAYIDLKNFWRHSPEEHIRAMPNFIEMKKYEGKPDPALVEFVITAWVIKEARQALNQALEQKIHGHGPNNLNYTQNRIDAALEAENRLFFTNPMDCGFTAEAKTERLSKIKSLIEQLEYDHAQMVRLAKETKSIRQILGTAVEQFKTGLSNDPLSQSYDAWIGLEANIDYYSERLSELDRRFDFESGALVLKKIINLVPPAK